MATQDGHLLRLFDDAQLDVSPRPEGDTEYSEQEVLELLRKQLAFLLENRRDWLLGKLYRLDVRERDIKAALAAPNTDVATELARLIVARQAERAAARRKFAEEGDKGTEIPKDLAW